MRRAIDRTCLLSALAFVMLAMAACGGGKDTASSTVAAGATPAAPAAAARTSATGSAGTATPAPALDCQSATAPAVPPPADNPTAITPSDVLCLVAAAASLGAVPRDLVPPLERAEVDYGSIAPSAQRCIADDPVTEVPDCLFGDPAGTRSLIVLGDSHAWMWIPTFDAIGRAQKWKVTLLSKSGCPPVYASVYHERNKTEFKECARWHDYAIARINQAQPDLVVLSSASARDGQGQPFSRDGWSTALQEMLKRLTLPAGHKLILGAVPFPRLGDNQVSGPDCLAAHESNLQACAVPFGTAIAGSLQPAEQQAAEQSGARYIDPSGWFCSKVCTPVIGRMNVYVHGGHLSATYARYLAGPLQALLVPILTAP